MNSEHILRKWEAHTLYSTHTTHTQGRGGIFVIRKQVTLLSYEDKQAGDAYIYIYVKVCRLKVILRASLSSPNGLLALPSKYSSAQLYYRLTPNNSLFSVPFSNIKHLLLWALHSWTKGAGTAIGAATLHVWADVIFSSHMQIHMPPFPSQQQPKELALQLPKVMLLLVLLWWLILEK